MKHPNENAWKNRQCFWPWPEPPPSSFVNALIRMKIEKQILKRKKEVEDLKLHATILGVHAIVPDADGE
jgi:hypothetical protein